MKAATWIALALGAIGVAAVAAWYFTRARKDAIMARCQALQAELARISVQGGDVSRQNELRAMIGTCLSEAAAAGFAIDYDAVALSECKAMQTQIDQEFSHYRATAMEDLIKRNNARGQVLRLSETMAACYSGLADQLYTTAAGKIKPGMTALDYAIATKPLRDLRADVNFGLSQAIARKTCYSDPASGGNTQSGCGRNAYNEAHNLEKARDEQARAIEPLRAVVTKIRTNIQRLSAAVTEMNARAATPGAFAGAAARGLTA
jgi:hypothetical protein